MAMNSEERSRSRDGKFRNTLASLHPGADGQHLCLGLNGFCGLACERPPCCKEKDMLILLIVLLLVFGFGGYRMGPGIGYYGGGGISLIILILIILLLLRVI